MPAPDEYRHDLDPTPLQDDLFATPVLRINLSPYETIPPEVGGFVPPAGSTIGRNERLQFDVTDNSGEIRRTFVWVSFPETELTVQELVWDGDGFTPDYAAYSTRTAIENGWRYSIRRRSGWPASIVEVRVSAIDPSGTVSA